MKNKTLIVTTFLSIFFFNSASAQTPIAIQAAIDTALVNNLSIKNEKLKAAYKKQLIKTSAAIPQAELSLEWGNMNSSYTDSKVGLTQGFSFPTVYAKHKKLLTEEWNSTVLGAELKEAELRKYVSQVFYSILYLKGKEVLLLEHDSLYAAFLRKSELRFSAGASNSLEKATAASQRGSIMLQLNELRQELALADLQFQLLLNSSNHYVPEGKSLNAELALEVSEATLSRHPALKLLEQEQVLAAAATQVEKSKLLPEISLGYFNSSMIGNGADDVYYASSKRFQYGALGIGIPLFHGSQKAKIAASRLNERLAKQEYDLGQQQAKHSYQAALVQYKNQLENLRYYEQSALDNAKLIQSAASQQFDAGEIDYLAWVTLMNQAILIQNDYLEAVNALNERTIQLNFLTQN